MTIRLISPKMGFFLCLLFVFILLLTSAFLTHGEYGDGYSTITNGRYWYADNSNYNAQRGPLAGLAMWPVELFIGYVEWNPVDIRPYHVYSAFLHTLYLLGCWLLLKSVVPGQSRYADAARLLALVAALLSTVFYAFSPFLNHDIIPGLLFLCMIYLCHRWLHQPAMRTALWLVLIGTSVTWIKQTYAIFWVILILYAFIAYALRWDEQRVGRRQLVQLLILALVSGILSLLGWGLWLAQDMPNEFILFRPWLMAQAISARFGAFPTLFSQDLYLRNVHNYGVTAMLLVVPGLFSAYYAQNARLRMIAVCWVLSVVMMQVIAFKEVRYLLFLAPLTAALILPMIQHLLKQRVLTLMLLALILLDQYQGWSLVARQLASTGGVNVAQFIDAPRNKGRAITSSMLTFIYMADSPLTRDLYHGIYHLTPRLLQLLSGGQIEVVRLDNPADLGQMGIKPGDRVYWANTHTLRGPPWATMHNRPVKAEHIVLIAGDAALVQLVREGDEYVINHHEGGFILFMADQAMGQQMPVISASGLSLAQAEQLYGNLQGKNKLSVVAVIVQGFCRSEQCVYD